MRAGRHGCERVLRRIFRDAHLVLCLARLLEVPAEPLHFVLATDLETHSDLGVRTKFERLPAIEAVSKGCMRERGAKDSAGHARCCVYRSRTPPKQQQPSLVMFLWCWPPELRPLLEGASLAKGCMRSPLVAGVWPPDLGTTDQQPGRHPIPDVTASSAAFEWPIQRTHEALLLEVAPASHAETGGWVL
jgi:hypothetical protein